MYRITERINRINLWYCKYCKLHNRTEHSYVISHSCYHAHDSLGCNLAYMFDMTFICDYMATLTSLEKLFWVKNRSCNVCCISNTIRSYAFMHLWVFCLRHVNVLTSAHLFYFLLASPFMLDENSLNVIWFFTSCMKWCIVRWKLACMFGNYFDYISSHFADDVQVLSISLLTVIVSLLLSGLRDCLFPTRSARVCQVNK
jgi:hypothetical protein